MPIYTHSGHETFSLRISWLPKAVAALEIGVDPFTEPRIGMAALGLGKNMIRSLAFWVQATGLAGRHDGLLSLTDFANQVLSREHGADPFLENTQTLWLLHWNLCQGWEENETRCKPYAWHYFANLLTDDELTPTTTVEHYFAGPRSRSTGKELSFITLRQHFDVFVKTYVPGISRGLRSTPEDALDSPLTTLGLIKHSGETKMANGKREDVYRINSAPKPTISNETFRHCLHSWWNSNHSGDNTLTIRQVAVDDDSPGRCFRLPDGTVHEMLSALSNSYPTEIKISESRHQRTVTRLTKPRRTTTLKAIYSS